MTVVIRPDEGDGQADSLKALLAAVTKVAGNEPVSVGSGGVVMSRAVARKFLNARTTAEDRAATSGHTADNTRTPLITRREGDTPGTVPDDDTSIGGLTPEGDLPGGAAGVPADANAETTAAGQAADGDSAPDASGGADAAESTPARKSTPAKKTTAAAAQRASRSTSSARSNP